MREIPQSDARRKLTEVPLVERGGREARGEPSWGEATSLHGPVWAISRIVQFLDSIAGSRPENGLFDSLPQELPLP